MSFQATMDDNILEGLAGHVDMQRADLEMAIEEFQSAAERLDSKGLYPGNETGIAVRQEMVREAREDLSRIIEDYLDAFATLQVVKKEIEIRKKTG